MFFCIVIPEAIKFTLITNHVATLGRREATGWCNRSRFPLRNLSVCEGHGYKIVKEGIKGRNIGNLRNPRRDAYYEFRAFAYFLEIAVRRRAEEILNAQAYFRQVEGK